MNADNRRSVDPLRVISYGGGVQSTALVVLAAQGKLGRVDGAVFANVGDDSEHPATLAYIPQVVQWAAERGVTIHEVRKTRRDGTQPTLMATVLDPERRRHLIPIRLSGGHPGKRSCTADWKVGPIQKWLKAHGATADSPADVLIGISTDEFHRAGNGRDHDWERRRYPLLDLGLSRADCIRVTLDAGLPEPPKSACWFCPFHGIGEWERMRRDDPELFDRAAAMETAMNVKAVEIGGGPVWFTDRLGPLADVIDPADPALPFPDPVDGTCDSGYCFT